MGWQQWPQYVKRIFFATNGIVEAERKKAVFLFVLGAATYKVLRNLLSPEKPGDKN
jgi:hypothetical protein